MTNFKCNKHFYFLVTLILITPVLLFASPSTPAEEEQEKQSDFDALKQKFEEAYSAGDYSKALETGKRMNEIAEARHYEILYNLARLHALLGDKAKTYEYLNRAIDAGFWNVMQMRKDEDLAGIREEDYFKQLSRTAWSNGYLAMLEREERDEFQKPDEVMKSLELKPGDRVADIGAGSGYFTIPIAKAVGPTGKVWAIDIFQEMLDYIDRRIKAEQLENVELVKVERDDPQLPPSGVDMVLMVDVFHYINDCAEYAKKIKGGLAPGGRVVVIDYIPKPWEERPWGPAPEQQLPVETLNAEMEKAGLKIVREYDFLPEQYFVVYQAE